MRRLALHQITAMTASPLELVALAAETGCQQVCLFTHVPAAALPDASDPVAFPLVDRDNVGPLRRHLLDHGIGVGNIEFFPVVADGDIERYREGFALGALIGARRAVTHIHDDDDARAVDTLGRLCDLAADHDLRLGLEFMGLTPACASIQRGVWFVEQVGRGNIGIGCDLLHLTRTGGTADDIGGLPPHLFTYGQICDGHGRHVTGDYLPEALDRLLPGDGDWPIRDVLRALPRSAALDVEVPNSGNAPGEETRRHVVEAVRRSRTLLDA